MTEAEHRRSYPRASLLQATARLAELSGMNIDEASKVASNNFEGMRFHHTPEQIVSEEDLMSLRLKTLELATKFGFPTTRTRLDGQSANQFDIELASLLYNEMEIIPAEAADDEVWWFITLFLLPDVALWRFPLANEVSAESPATWHVRFMDRRRGFFRQAWWRYFLLGKEVCEVFNEDEFLNLVDRVALSGYKPLAEALSFEFICRLKTSNYVSGERRSVFRQSMILARRALGHEAVYAMDTERMSIFASTIFDKSEKLVRQAAIGDESIDEAFLESEFSEGSLNKFLTELGTIAQVLMPYITRPNLSDQFIFELREMLPVYARLHPGNEQVAKISQDLEHLLAGIQGLNREDQLIVYAATAYFLLAEDAIPDASKGGFDDDEKVLDLAFKCLQRSRPSSVK
ncbi:hypothetical protein [Aurantimicrobium sp. MWH-Uga1]|uniref:hypothetical protein n=1 Tax=Aurantimicrobium sp. MWH-Uga1 TaxID=2079575 RepID=UPI000DEDB45D|nr:hypothetical protein [Aurantimicrobium sp. MWH-Uga1]AXE53946.1 hypothetical protein AURUGA1_00234 [Aurantimicrobium sp. MWH-Uga1]